MSTVYTHIYIDGGSIGHIGVDTFSFIDIGVMCVYFENVYIFIYVYIRIYIYT